MPAGNSQWLWCRSAALGSPAQAFAHRYFVNLRIRYERDPHMHTVFITLACSILCGRRLQSF